MFHFGKQTPEFICMNGFNVCLNLYLLEIFFIFVNLPLRILTPYSVAFFVFSGCFFKKSHNFYFGRLGKPRRHLEFHYT